MQTVTSTPNPARIPDRRRYERQLGVVLWAGLFAVLYVIAR